MRIVTAKRAGPSLSVAALLTAVGSPVAAQAPAGQDPLIGDRPDHTESPATVFPGRVQVEAGYTLEREGEDTKHVLGEAVVRFGLVPRLEFRLGFPSVELNRESGETAGGLADISLGFKWNLLSPDAEPGWIPMLALLGSVSIPTGSADVRAPGAEPEAILAAGWLLTERLALGWNASWAEKEDGDGRFEQFGASAVLSYSLFEPVGVFFEYFGQYPSGSRREARNFLDAGLTYLISTNVQIDGRFGIGLDGPRPSYFFGTGIVLRTR
jgi:hypothetical protein